MFSKIFCQQAASLALAATLAVPQLGFAATAEGPTPTPTVKLIFPGQPLPKELGFSPLKVGSNGDSDVQVANRDWFLLKDKNLALLNPVAGKTLDIVGPVLDANNAQMYFRLISGMILKESMVQMGMNAGQARRYIEKAQQAGIDFDQAPLASLGELPKGLSYLYDNWDRTNVKMALMPNILLPLAVAYDQSNLMHFAKASVDDQEAQKTCSTITTVAPIGPIQNKIAEKQKQLETINTDLRNAQARLTQSKAEQVRLNGVIKDVSSTIDTHMQCFDVIKSRVSRGGAMPDQACLNLASAAMAEEQLQTQWAKFTSVNLKNDQGDESVKKQMETEVHALEARVAETQAIVRTLQEQQDKANQEQAQDEGKLKRLNEIYGPEKSKEADLDKEQQELRAELLNLQTRDYKIKTGSLKSELSEEEYKAAIADIPKNEKRMSWIEQRSKQIVPEQVKRQSYQASLLTQIQGVTGAMDQRKAQLATIDVQLNDKTTGYNAKLAALQAQLKEMNPKFIKATDEATFSDYVVSILMKKLSQLGQNRDMQFAMEKQEEARAAKYEQEIAAAGKTKDDRYDSIQAEITSLQALIAGYMDIAQMGWFLETDCAASCELFRPSARHLFKPRENIRNVFVVENAADHSGRRRTLGSFQFGLRALSSAHSKRNSAERSRLCANGRASDSREL